MNSAVFSEPRNDEAADQKRLIHYQSLRDSKMAAAPGSVFLAHFKDCILLRSHSWIVFWGPMET